MTWTEIGTGSGIGMGGEKGKRTSADQVGMTVEVVCLMSVVLMNLLDLLDLDLDLTGRMSYRPHPSLRGTHCWPWWSF